MQLYKRLMVASGGGGGTGIVASDDSQTGTTASLTGLGLQENDVVVIFTAFGFNVVDNRTITGTAGWDVTDGGNFSPDIGGFLNAGLAIKKMTATPDSSFSFSISGASVGAIGLVIVVVRGYPGTVTSVTPNSSTDGPIDPPSQTGLSAGDATIVVGARFNTTATLSAAGNYSSSLVQRTTTSTSVNTSQGIAINLSPSTPVESPSDWTGGGGGNNAQWSGIFGVKP